MLTAEQRHNFGRSRRRVVKRSAQSEWNSTARKHDPIEIILATNRGLIRELVPLKMARMATSPFAFYRGGVPVIAADLSSVPNTRMRAQICGDAHVRNLGAYTGTDGRLIFDINDFDETIFAPWELDLKRLGASLVLAGREAQNSDAACKKAVRDFVRMYRQKILEFASLPAVSVARYRVRRPFEGGPGSAVLRKAERATPIHLLDHHTKLVPGGVRAFKAVKTLLTPLSKSASKPVLSALRSYRATVSAERRHILDFYSPQEVAFKVVGLGSVGMHDYLVFANGNGAKDPLFLQVKEETQSSYSRFIKNDSSRMHQGRRVVEGQRRMQTQSDLLLGWTSFGGRDFLVRQFCDHKGGIENKILAGSGLSHYANTCGEVLAKAHARSGDPCELAGYLGSGNSFDRAIEKFSVKYADQVTLDYEKFRSAVRSGKIRAARDPMM